MTFTILHQQPLGGLQTGQGRCYSKQRGEKYSKIKRQKTQQIIMLITLNHRGKTLNKQQQTQRRADRGEMRAQQQCEALHHSDLQSLVSTLQQFG